MRVTPRALIVDTLAPLLPAGVVVVPYARQVDAPAKSTVMVRVDEVRRAATQGSREYVFALVLIAGQTAAGPGDDELDGLLEDVLYALETGAGGLLWTQAVRATYESANPAYEVRLTVTMRREGP